MQTFGPCQEPGCGLDALVGLNGRFFCLTHYERAVERIGEVIEKVKAMFGEEE